mmetsp:Transcript_33269/g.107613  ORF Transcript_33269/g.107613 Transcript_33269/m.107613 type:complete len:303 (-) Transcript_33269:1908-2816(-)
MRVKRGAGVKGGAQLVPRQRERVASRIGVWMGCVWVGGVRMGGVRMGGMGMAGVGRGGVRCVGVLEGGLRSGGVRMGGVGREGAGGCLCGVGEWAMWGRRRRAVDCNRVEDGLAEIELGGVCLEVYLHLGHEERKAFVADSPVVLRPPRRRVGLLLGPPSGTPRRRPARERRHPPKIAEEVAHAEDCGYEVLVLVGRGGGVEGGIDHGVLPRGQQKGHVDGTLTTHEPCKHRQGQHSHLRNLNSPPPPRRSPPPAPHRLVLSLRPEPRILSPKCSRQPRPKDSVRVDRGGVASGWGSHDLIP